jgi:hypothetical protein
MRFPFSRRPVASLASLALAIAVLLAALPAAGGAGLFDYLVGTWSGTGTVKLTEGGREKIKCKAAYEVPESTRVNLHLTCASDTYKITLNGTMQYRDGVITGTWGETTRDVEGSFTGRVNGNQIVLNTSGIIAAALTVTTTGPSQTVVLKIEGAKVSSVSITLKREGVSVIPADVPLMPRTQASLDGPFCLAHRFFEW